MIFSETGVTSVPTSSELEISTDFSRIDIPAVHAFLTTSYWAEGRPIGTVEASLRNSLCFGAYVAGKQVAFGRVVTDYSTFRYLADVFVFPAYLGRGFSKKLVDTIVAHPQLQGVGLLLRTRGAHGLYRQFGFKPPRDHGTIMVLPNGPEAVSSPDSRSEQQRHE